MLLSVCTLLLWIIKEEPTLSSSTGEDGVQWNAADKPPFSLLSFISISHFLPLNFHFLSLFHFPPFSPFTLLLPLHISLSPLAFLVAHRPSLSPPQSLSSLSLVFAISFVSCPSFSSQWFSSFVSQCYCHLSCLFIPVFVLPFPVLVTCHLSFFTRLNVRTCSSLSAALLLGWDVNPALIYPTPTPPVSQRLTGSIRQGVRKRRRWWIGFEVWQSPIDSLFLDEGRATCRCVIGKLFVIINLPGLTSLKRWQRTSALAKQLTCQERLNSRRSQPTAPPGCQMSCRQILTRCGVETSCLAHLFNFHQIPLCFIVYFPLSCCCALKDVIFSPPRGGGILSNRSQNQSISNCSYVKK